MSQKGSISGNVLWGILLGFAIVTAWLFYPDIWTIFKSSTPRAADKISTIKEKIVSVKLPILQEKDEPPLTDNSGKKAENKDVPEMPEAKAEEAKDASEKKTMYACWKFDERGTAEDFIKSIEKQSGVDLGLGQEGYKYVVYIPASDEAEKSEKEDLIKRFAGITVN